MVKNISKTPEIIDQKCPKKANWPKVKKINQKIANNFQTGYINFSVKHLEATRLLTGV